MPREDFRQGAGDVGTNHRRSVDSSRARVFTADMNRLEPAISPLEEIQVYRGLGDALCEVSFEPQPLFPAFSFRGCEFQIGPSPRSVYQCARFKLAGCGHDSERTGGSDTLHRDLLSRVHAGAFGRTPESGIEVKACDAGGGRIYSSLKSTSVEEEACFRNAHCVPQQGCMIVIKKF